MKDDIDYGALFGVDEGGNGQEVADPALTTDDGAQGEEEQEVAAPAEGEEDTADTGDGGDENNGEGAADESVVQDPKERARFAAARRKAEAERDAAVKKAKEEAAVELQRAVDEAFALTGITNPYTGQPIRSKAEYEAYRTQAAEDRRDKLLRKSGMTEAEYKEFVDDLPEVKAARAAKEQADAAAQTAREAAARQKVDEQLTEIAKFDPSVKTLADLAKTENYPKVYEMVKKGYDLADAYKLANFDAVRQSTAEVTRQAAMNAAAGKGHLSGTSSRGVGTVSVPADVKEMYRMFDPDATDAEIQKHYNRYAKK